MRFLFLAVIALCSFGVSNGYAKPKLVDTPLKRSGNVPSVVAKNLGTKFQALVKKSADIAKAGSVTKAMKDLKLPAACETLACGRKLAEKLSRRFVLFTSLSNEDDTYTVVLKLYDQSSNGFVAESKQNCEFCAAKEVEGTFKKAWSAVAPALSKPASKPKAAEPSKVSILTIPPGASIVLNGKKLDKLSPHDVKLPAGTHSIEVGLKGYVSAKRTVTVKDGPVELPIIELIKTSDLAGDSTPVIPNKTSSIYGLSLGMLITGSILTGTGAWLTVKDGSLTCRDGRNRQTCPEVYNTKYLGLAAGGVGGILMGASAALLIKDYLDTRKAEKPVSLQTGVTQDAVNVGVTGRF